MNDSHALQIANQLCKIVIELAAIREAREKLVAHQDHPAYTQEKRY